MTHWQLTRFLATKCPEPESEPQPEPESVSVSVPIPVSYGLRPMTYGRQYGTWSGSCSSTIKPFITPNHHFPRTKVIPTQIMVPLIDLLAHGNLLDGKRAACLPNQTEPLRSFLFSSFLNQPKSQLHLSRSTPHPSPATQQLPPEKKITLHHLHQQTSSTAAVKSARLNRIRRAVMAKNNPFPFRLICTPMDFGYMRS